MVNSSGCGGVCCQSPNWRGALPGVLRVREICGAAESSRAGQAGCRDLQHRAWDEVQCGAGGHVRLPSDYPPSEGEGNIEATLRKFSPQMFFFNLLLQCSNVLVQCSLSLRLPSPRRWGALAFWSNIMKLWPSNVLFQSSCSMFFNVKMFLFNVRFPSDYPPAWGEGNIEATLRKFSPQMFLFNVQMFLFNVQMFLFNVQMFLFNVQMFLFNVQMFLFNVQCSNVLVQCSNVLVQCSNVLVQCSNVRQCSNVLLQCSLSLRLPSQRRWGALPFFEATLRNFSPQMWMPCHRKKIRRKFKNGWNLVYSFGCSLW